MISSRNFVVSIIGALLSAAPLVSAQDLSPLYAASISPRPAVIQDLALQPQPFLSSLYLWPGNPAPLIHAPDLSKYREFQFGTNLLVVAKQVDMEPSEARVIHQRPAVIQELDWRPLRSLGSSSQADSVSEVLLSFYNGELFQMLVNYDRYRTEGLTDEDMVEAISARYGTASRPDAKLILFSSFQVYNDTEKVIARWEDSHYSFNLFRSSYQPTFGMLIFSKRLNPLAEAANAQAIRLDEEEAPQREIERQKQQDEANRAKQEKARKVNKADFRP
jgi:hypothetical protein